MKKWLIFILILLLAKNTSAQENWMFTADQVTTSISISENLDVIKTGGSFRAEYITANVSFIPSATWKQEILSSHFSPEPEDVGDVAFFRWENPGQGVISFEIAADVRVTNDFAKVLEKIRFPLKELPDNIVKYTLPTDNIDSNDPRIIALASTLADGEDDLFLVTHKLAEWTQENVEYNLSTLNVQASQSASWVLEHREGVCDELTTLFIAMARSLGIPARFISGIAYTDSPDFDENWGAHGWAEVYFPGVGWTDWDVTYGQYGFIDPTHVKLKSSLDSNEAATRYVWRGRDMEVTAGVIDVSADLIEKTGTIDERYTLSIDALQKNVGIGSYNIVKGHIKNNMDSYVSATLYLSRITEMVTDDPYIRRVALAPETETTVYWIVRVDPALDPNYLYTFPITVGTPYGESASSTFTAAESEAVYSFADMSRIVDSARESESSDSTGTVSIECLWDKDTYYTYDSIALTCTVSNDGNTFLKDLRICRETDCRVEDIGISKSRELHFKLKNKGQVTKKVEISAKNDQIVHSIFENLDILAEPSISIDSLEYPDSVRYTAAYTTEFILKKSSRAVPYNISITLDRGTTSKTWTLEELTSEKKYMINLRGSDLTIGDNRFDILVEWYDLNGGSYSTEQEFSTALIDVTMGQRISIFIKDIDRWIRGLFKS